jgi:hypothetical protein
MMGAAPAIDPEESLREMIDSIIEELKVRKTRVLSPTAARYLSLAMNDLESAQNWIDRSNVR